MCRSVGSSRPMERRQLEVGLLSTDVLFEARLQLSPAAREPPGARRARPVEVSGPRPPSRNPGYGSSASRHRDSTRWDWRSRSTGCIGAAGNRRRRCRATDSSCTVHRARPARRSPPGKRLLVHASLGSVRILMPIWVSPSANLRESTGSMLPSESMLTMVRDCRRGSLAPPGTKNVFYQLVEVPNFYRFVTGLPPFVENRDQKIGIGSRVGIRMSGRRSVPVVIEGPQEIDGIHAQLAKMMVDLEAVGRRIEDKTAATPGGPSASSPPVVRPWTRITRYLRACGEAVGGRPDVMPAVEIQPPSSISVSWSGCARPAASRGWILPQISRSLAAGQARRHAGRWSDGGAGFAGSRLRPPLLSRGARLSLAL